ncbi:MAG: hypothetical protein GYA62_15905, partial [Bacteroidales bacterium]|nr:hypothetical protein [Bacteroidales bacterium]
MIKKNFFSIIFLLAVSLLKAQDTTNEYLRIVNEFEKNNREKFNNSDDKIKKHYMRYRTWWDYRLDKHQNIKAYRKVWMDYYKNNSIITSNTNKNLPQMTWEQIGPSDLNLTNKINNVGRCVSVAVDPTNPNIVYIGTSNSGLWKTTNALTNDPKAVQWTCLTDNVSSLGVWSIAIKPDNPDVIFFVGGVRQVNITGGEKYYSLGVFKSTDGGNTFTNILPLNPDDDVAFTQILFHPTNFNIVFLLGDNLLLKSTDGGNTFNLLQGFPDDSQLRQMAINTSNPDELMIGGYNGSVLYYTNDGGININNIYNPAVFGTNSENLFPAYNPVNGYFYVVYYSGIKKTNNGGNSWETVFTNNPPYQDLTIMSYVTHLAISNNNEIYVGGIKCILFSNDLWVNYLLPSNQIHADVRAVGFSNSANGAPVFIVTDGGVCRNLNGGVYGWESINGNLTISEFYDLDVCISNPEIMLGGTMDCGTLKRNEDGTWLHINGSDGGGTSVNGYNCNYCLSSMGAGPQYLMYSTNGGNSWAYCSDIEPLIKYNTPVFRVPASQDIVYTGVWNLKKSLNNGTNFQSVHDGGGTYVSCIDISPLNPSYISYAEYRNWIEQGMASSLNIYNGQFWYTITAQTTPYPFAQDMEIVPIVDIEFSPIEQNTLFICFGGLEAAGKIYKSTNLGQSWIDITYNLPNIPYTDLEYDSNTNILYLGSDFGVFYLEQNSTTWNKLSGLPDMIISKIKILPELGEIVVATFGRGIFKTSYCTYNSTPLVVNTNQIWSSDKKLFSDLIIDNNSTLTIEKHLFVPDAATITVKNGSTLILNENSILQGACKEYYEGSIIVEPGGRMVLKDNSTVKLAGNGIIYIED